VGRAGSIGTVGLTGGIASGKSTVAERLEQRGALVVDGDRLAHTALEPDGAAYSLYGALRLDGDLDLRALEAALNEVIRRQDSLRTTFRSVRGRPVQEVAAHGPWRLPLVDLGGLVARSETAERLLTSEARRPFDLAA